MSSVAEQALTNETPSAPRRDNRRPQLLDAAARNFRDQGYAAASMRDIAADAGMKAGSMYYYFASKADLLLAVHEEGIRRISEAVENAVAAAASPSIAPLPKRSGVRLIRFSTE